MKFTYSTMGGSKTAQVLMKRFDYEEHGLHVFLAKPSTDIRDGATTIRSRIGLSAEAHVIMPKSDVVKLVKTAEKTNHVRYHIIIVDEAQFLTTEQVDQLRYLADYGYDVHCYGLKTSKSTKLFEGSKRLIEVSDKIEKFDTTCNCGRQADVNARVVDGVVTMSGDVVDIGGNDKYRPMCHKCFRRAIAQNRHPNINAPTQVAVIPGDYTDTCDVSKDTNTMTMVRIRQIIDKIRKPENLFVRLHLEEWICKSRTYADDMIKQGSAENPKILRLRYVLNHICPNLAHEHSQPIPFAGCMDDPKFVRDLFEYNYENSQATVEGMDGVMHPGIEYTEEEWDALFAFCKTCR